MAGKRLLAASCWLAVAAVVVAMQSATAVGGLASAGWPTLQGNNQRTSCTSNIGPDQPYLLWKVPLEANSFSATVGPDGTIYATTTAGLIHAFSSTGQSLWSYTTGGAIYGSPTVDSNGDIYVSSNDGYLYALDHSGALQWRYNLTTSFAGAPSLASNGNLWIMGNYHLYQLDQNGHLVSNTSLNATTGQTALLSNGDIVVRGVGTAIYRVSSSGNVVWSKSMPSSTGNVVVGPGDVIYAGQYNSRLYAIDPADGHTRWLTTMEHSGSMYVGIAHDGSLYVAADGSLEKVAPDGTHLWSLYDVAQRAGAPVIDGHDTLYLSDGEIGNNLRAISAASDILWTFTAQDDSWRFNQPALGANGVLYVPSWSYNYSQGYLYAIVPEPATLGLLAAGLSALLVRRQAARRGHRGDASR